MHVTTASYKFCFQDLLSNLDIRAQHAALVLLGLNTLLGLQGCRRGSSLWTMIPVRVSGGS